MRSFVSAAWSSCGGPWRSVASESAVALTTTPRSPSSNAWPARPRHATSRHKMRPTSLRALRRVPSGVAVCADRPEPYPTAPGGSVFTIDTGSVFVIGPKAHEIPEDLLRNDGAAMVFTPDDVRQNSPNTLSIVKLNSKRDLHIFRKVYAHSFRIGDNAPVGRSPMHKSSI